MNVPKIIGLLVLCCLMFSCEEEKPFDGKKTNTEIKVETITNKFLFNVPIVADTVFIDKQYNIDIRIELVGYSIDSVTITNNERIILMCDTTIISSRSLYFYENPARVEFLIRSVNLENKDTVYFKSNPILFKTVENLSNLYVFNSTDNGKLKLTWREFDKNNTQKYLVERWMIDDNFGQNLNGTKKYYQSFEVGNAEFFDNYYVGEETEYKITVINKEGNQQDIWYYKKSKEQPSFYVTQNSASGYNLHFGKCKYYNNFGQYYLTTEWNYSSEFIHSTTQINDTTYWVSNAKFGDEARFWIRYLPKQLPNGFVEDDWNIYGKYLYAQYGMKSVAYEYIAVLDNNYFAYTSNGKVFKYNIANNQVVDSMVTNIANYENLKSTPDGKFIYATNRSQSDYTIYFWHFWSTNIFSPNPIYDFRFTTGVLPVSNNLRTIMPNSNDYSTSKLAIYDVTNGKIIYTTSYGGGSNYPAISPDGDYFLIYDMGYLRLCRYANNSFEVIWTQSDWTKYYLFYNFNRLNNNLCYTWDDNNIFTIRKTSDFSVINSFPLELQSIVDIDYQSNIIMGYITDKVMIYDLNKGNLIKEIPANLSELFAYSNRSVLLGNTIYNNQGIKYEINK